MQTTVSQNVARMARRPSYLDPQLLATEGGARSQLMPDTFEAASVEDRPVVAALNYFFNEAAENDYSDIHLESDARGLVVRYRQFGVLQQKYVLDGALADDFDRMLRARAQVRDKDDIAPRDGTFWFKATTRTIDVRLSFLKTRMGQSIVCRLLDQNNATRPFSSIPMRVDQRALFLRALYETEGLILTVGPTGSGKTSTLYSCLTERNTQDIKILTVEDPVEYTLSNAQQVNVQRPLRTFPIVVRAAMRQDIDIAMVGEIRDAETAATATDISNTGHLVLSTLHANSAASAINRLLSGLKVDAFALAAGLRLIVAQRLVRTLCTKCRRIERVTADEVALLKGCGYVSPDGAELADLHTSHKHDDGCEACDYRGTRGIRPILEFAECNGELRGVIESGADPEIIRRTVNAQLTRRSLNHAALDAALDDHDVDFKEALVCARSAD